MRAYQQACDLNRKGNEAYAAGNFAQAASYYEQAVNLDPYGDQTIIQNYRSALGSRQNELGNDAYAKGDYATAVTHYREALGHKPESEIIRENLTEAEAALQQKLAEQAAAVAQERRDVETTGRLREQLRGFSQKLNRTGGPDFDGRAKGTQSGGLDFLGSSTPAVATKRGLPAGLESGASPVTDAHVVDLRQAGSLVLEPQATRVNNYASSFGEFTRRQEFDQTLDSLCSLQKESDRRLAAESYAQLLARLDAVSDEALGQKLALPPEADRQLIAMILNGHAQGTGTDGQLTTEDLLRMARSLPPDAASQLTGLLTAPAPVRVPAGRLPTPTNTLPADADKQLTELMIDGSAASRRPRATAVPTDVDPTLLQPHLAQGATGSRAEKAEPPSAGLEFQSAIPARPATVTHVPTEVDPALLQPPPAPPIATSTRERALARVADNVQGTYLRYRYNLVATITRSTTNPVADTKQRLKRLGDEFVRQVGDLAE